MVNFLQVPQIASKGTFNPSCIDLFVFLLCKGSLDGLDEGALATNDDIPDEDISLRDYQKELAEPAIRGSNVLIVAPTGSGKTRVALKIIQV